MISANLKDGFSFMRYTFRIRKALEAIRCVHYTWNCHKIKCRRNNHL